MVFHSFARVFGGGFGPDYERPVTGLSEEQFARSLLERPLGQGFRLREAARQFSHALFRHSEMRINPFILLVEPHFPITFLAPARGAWGGNLVGRMGAQVILRSDQAKDLLIA